MHLRNIYICWFWYAEKMKHQCYHHVLEYILKSYDLCVVFSSRLVIKTN